LRGSFRQNPLIFGRPRHGFAKNVRLGREFMPHACAAIRRIRVQKYPHIFSQAASIVADKQPSCYGSRTESMRFRVVARWFTRK
jgi:hypothetical protein